MEETQIRSLVQLAQSGDREAFGQLVTAFEPIVYRVVLRRLRDASDAREVTQEVFLRAMRKIGQLREPERFAGWLRQIAVRMSISNIVRRPGVATVSVQTFDAFQSDPTTPVDTLLKTEE
ncbi:MAG: sigma factor, partial [Planctomycetaceae bacterium]